MWALGGVNCLVWPRFDGLFHSEYARVKGPVKLQRASLPSKARCLCGQQALLRMRVSGGLAELTLDLRFYFIKSIS